jgi:hypothetical protein
MAKRKRKTAEAIEIATPTPEQEGKGEFRRIGMHYRRVPVIDTLYGECKLTSRQFNALARYRDVAVAVDRSPVEDSVGKLLRNCVGGGEGGLDFALRTAIELGRLERALGSLADIARAIAVEEVTLSDWAMKRHGSHERVRGNVIKFEPSKAAFKEAWMDIRMAGERLAAEIGA